MKKLHTVRTFLAGIPAALRKPIKITMPAFALALILAAGLVVGVNAVNDKKQIVAYEDYTIAIKLDGEIQIPTNANGTRVYPITYNGTTYLPIRAVAGMAGLLVDWDQANQTVLLMTTPADGLDLIDNFKAYYLSGFSQVQSTAKKTKDISGDTYSHWLGLDGSFGSGTAGTASFNIDGKYDTVTFKYYATRNLTLQVIGDNDYLLAEIPVTGGQVAQTITVELLGTSQLTFKTVEKLGYDQHMYIMNALLK